VSRPGFPTGTRKCNRPSEDVTKASRYAQVGAVPFLDTRGVKRGKLGPNDRIARFGFGSDTGVGRGDREENHKNKAPRGKHSKTQRLDDVSRDETRETLNERRGLTMGGRDPTGDWGAKNFKTKRQILGLSSSRREQKRKKKKRKTEAQSELSHG